MYKVEKTHYGIKFRFCGFIDEQEVKRWAGEVRQATESLPKDFCFLADMRGMKPLPPAVWTVVEKAEAWAMKAGLKRAVQIVDDPITAMQLKRLAKHTGFIDRMRLIDASSSAAWEKAAMDWLLLGVASDLVDPAETPLPHSHER